MAAGRHGAYRDNDYGDRQSNLNDSRRGSDNIKEDNDQIRNGGRDPVRGRSRNGGDRIRVRQKEVGEREALNDSYQSSSSRSNSGSSGGTHPKRRGFSVKTMDREPGELSSESDDAMESEPQVKVKYSEDMKVEENGTRSPVGKKRKFSPIVWDQDDKDMNNPTKVKVYTTVNSLPPPPPIVSRTPSPSPPFGRDVVHPVRNTEANNLDLSTAVRHPLSSEAVKDAESESPVGFPTIAPERSWTNNWESEQPEGGDYVPTHNISSSRWAAANDSPGDEGEIIDDEAVPKRRRKLAPELLEAGVRNKLLSLEESKGEGLEKARAFESEGRGSYGRTSSGDDHQDFASVKDDHLEIDGLGGKDDANNNHSDTDSEEGDDHRETPEPPAPPQRVVNMLQGCRSVDEFERLNKIDEGTYGVVYRARDKKTGEIVALKKVKMEKEKEGFPLTSLREINILLSFHHPYIVDVKEVVVGSSLDSIFMVMEYMEHDLKGLMETMKHPFSQSEVKCLMLQLLEGVKYLHDNWVLHRDLKTSNLLLNNRGDLKICDFGLARQYGSPLKPYTHLVVTLWYRAPELLLGAKQYSTAIDMWSLGCIMAELLSKEPLFNGKNEFDQLDKIFRTLGTPNETIWPGFSKLPGVKVNFVKHQYNLLRKKFPATSFTGSPVLSDSGFDLLNKLLTYDPEKRITAEAALNHEWFREVPLPKSKEFMPTFPAQHAQDRRMRRKLKSPDPLQELRRKELQQGELGTGGIFG